MYPAIGSLLPAMGYSAQQVNDLQATIAKVPCDVVVVGTPMDLGRLVTIRQPVVRARYELQEVGQPDLAQVITEFLKGPSIPTLIRARCRAPS
jgi:predicted GTPase